jgi:hypothetical protein
MTCDVILVRIRFFPARWSSRTSSGNGHENAGEENQAHPQWAPNSPDLSVIENVWGVLKLHIAARGPKTVGEFTEMLQEGWDNLEMPVINRLFLSL